MRTLDYAVLGLVARQPCSGYDLAGLMRRPVGYYWAEGHGGIYPSLRRLSEAPEHGAPVAMRMARAEVAPDVRELGLEPEPVRVTAYCTTTWELLV